MNHQPQGPPPWTWNDCRNGSSLLRIRTHYDGTCDGRVTAAISPSMGGAVFQLWNEKGDSSPVYRICCLEHAELRAECASFVLEMANDRS